jgi:hypothetical protein
MFLYFQGVSHLWNRSESVQSEISGLFGILKIESLTSIMRMGKMTGNWKIGENEEKEVKTNKHFN